MGEREDSTILTTIHRWLFGGNIKSREYKKYLSVMYNKKTDTSIKDNHRIEIEFITTKIA